MQKYVAQAYEMTRRNDRFIEQSTNLVIAILAQFVNFVLLMNGLTGRWGIYVVLVFAALILLHDAVRFAIAARSGAPLRHSCNGSGEAATHTHMPPVHNDIQTFVLVWLLWWALSQFFYEAGIRFATNWPLLPLLFLCVLAVSVAPQSAATDIFPVLLLVVVAFPSPEWMPQYMTWTRDAARVFVYFVLVFAADFALERNALCEQTVHDAVSSDVLTRSRADVDESGDSVQAAYFCVTAAQYDAAYAAEHRRTKAIVALSAWVLVVPKLMIVLFIVGLAVVHALLVWQRRRTERQAPPPAPLPVSEPDLPVDDDDNASDSGSLEYAPETPRESLLPPPPPPVTSSRVTTQTIYINRQ